MRYHVFESIGSGYSPHDTESYATLEEARAHVAEWVESMKDFAADGPEDDPVEINNVDPDYATAEWGIGAYRNCYVEECHDPACGLCQEVQESEAMS
jgi:hypothetical protein